jgi:thiol-disulfide isomerase/thioredoxin
MRASPRLPALLLLTLAAFLFVATHAADAAAPPPPPPPIAELTATTLDSAAAASPILLMMHASWCTHCRRFMPSYGTVATELAGDNVLVAKSDGSVHRVLSQRFGTTGFPSFYLVDGKDVWEYTGRRSVEGLVAFARGGGREAGKEITGFAKPMGLCWVAAAKGLQSWERLRANLIKERYSPTLVICGVAGSVLVMLVVFAAVISYLTRPNQAQVKRD